MIGMPHHIVMCAKDRRLAADDRAVLILLTAGWLGDREFLPVRATALASELYDDPITPVPIRPWHGKNVSRAIRRLVLFGYLDKGDEVVVRILGNTGRLRTYRLRIPPTRVAPAATST